MVAEVVAVVPVASVAGAAAAAASVVITVVVHTSVFSPHMIMVMKTMTMKLLRVKIR